MADLTITAANVAKGAGAVCHTGTAGAAITAGQTIVENSSGVMVLADIDHATAGLRVPGGLALNDAEIGQPVVYQEKGPITIGATVAAGTPYFASPNPGGICPLADVLSGDRAVFLGWGISATQIDLNIVDSGVNKA